METLLHKEENCLLLLCARWDEVLAREAPGKNYGKIKHLYWVNPETLNFSTPSCSYLSEYGFTGPTSKIMADC